MSNTVTLEFMDATVKLESVGGSSAADVTTAINAHNADALAHGLTANIKAALTGAASPSAANVLLTQTHGYGGKLIYPIAGDIQTAINSGDKDFTVFLPAGTYTIGSTLILPALAYGDIGHLVGAGIGRTILQVATDIPIVQYAQGWEISDITFTGYTISPGVAGGTGINIVSGADGSEIHHCEFSTLKTGITGTPTFVSIYNNILAACTSYGMQLLDNSGSNSIRRCHFSGGGTGIWAGYGSGLFISDCTSRTLTTAIKLEGSQNPIIERCNFENDDALIVLDDSAPTSSPANYASRNVNIIGCESIFKNATPGQIFVYARNTIGLNMIGNWSTDVGVMADLDTAGGTVTNVLYLGNYNDNVSSTDSINGILLSVGKTAGGPADTILEILGSSSANFDLGTALRKWRTQGNSTRYAVLDATAGTTPLIVKALTPSNTMIVGEGGYGTVGLNKTPGATFDVYVQGWGGFEGVKVTGNSGGQGGNLFVGVHEDGTTVVFYVTPTGAINSAVEYRVAGTKVVGARVIDARCDDTINSGDATTDGVIDALRDAMIAHGLIAAA